MRRKSRARFRARCRRWAKATQKTTPKRFRKQSWKPSRRNLKKNTSPASKKFRMLSKRSSFCRIFRKLRRHTSSTERTGRKSGRKKDRFRSVLWNLPVKAENISATHSRSSFTIEHTRVGFRKKAEEKHGLKRLIAI